MRFALPLCLALILATVPCRAQLGESAGNFGEIPVEVDSKGGTRFEGGVAVAEDDVVIRYGGTSIYADYAQYDLDTREVFVRGNVRIYREGRVFTGDRAIYNLETKQLRAASFRGGFDAVHFSGDTLSSEGQREISIRNGIFTTSDSSKPDYYLRSKGVRIYPNDRIVFTGTTLYIGTTPVFWWPYLYQSLKEDIAFSITPGYSSRWGAFALSKYSFPIAEGFTGELRLDLRSKRGVGVGLGSDFAYGKNRRSYGEFRAYYTNDERPEDNPTGVPRGPIEKGRYRVSLQHRLYLTDELYSNIDFNLLSDADFLEDFDPGLFRIDPRPDNMVSLTKWHRNFAVTLMVRGQVNDFFETTERLPELLLEMKRQQLFHSPIFYEGETGFGWFRRNFADNDPFPDYDSFRADSFHQFLVPGTYFGWMSVVPRVGFRGTYYSKSNQFTKGTATGVPGSPTQALVALDQINDRGGSVFRPMINAGIESSFKLSRIYEKAQSRTLGLEGLMHVVQPYTNFSWVHKNHQYDDILRFDRLIPSSQLPPIDFPQFNTIDTIPDWSIWRLGVRNRLLTRRDNDTTEWMEIDTFVDYYFTNPEFGGVVADDARFSNLYNRIRWKPVPWVNFQLDSQLPIFASGFTEVNTKLDFLVNSEMSLRLEHRYINNNPFFEDSSLLGVGGYIRLGDHWGFSFTEQYEFDDNTLERQVYEIHRDLSSWVASLGFVVRNNRGGEDEIGILLSFTLKDLPAVSLPLNFDPQSQLQGSHE